MVWLDVEKQWDNLGGGTGQYLLQLPFKGVTLQVSGSTLRDLFYRNSCTNVQTRLRASLSTRAQAALPPRSVLSSQNLKMDYAAMLPSGAIP